MSHLHLSDKDPKADNYVDKIPEGYQVDVKKPTRYVLLQRVVKKRVEHGFLGHF